GSSLPALVHSQLPTVPVRFSCTRQFWAGVFHIEQSVRPADTSGKPQYGLPYQDTSESQSTDRGRSDRQSRNSLQSGTFAHGTELDFVEPARVRIADGPALSEVLVPVSRQSSLRDSHRHSHDPFLRGAGHAVSEQLSEQPAGRLDAGFNVAALSAGPLLCTV